MLLDLFDNRLPRGKPLILKQQISENTYHKKQSNEKIKQKRMAASCLSSTPFNCRGSEFNLRIWDV
jgi:hypothetical protein